MIVPDEGKDFLLGAFNTGIISVGLIIDEFPLITDTWASHAWSEQEEQVTTVDSITNGVLTLVEKTFTVVNDIKGFYVRVGTNLVFTTSLEDLVGTTVAIIAILGVTNVE